ncbi:hypothetical protein KEM48_011692 [Puccinia striiformis f. sp. tritici PST-130]|nr:hypothetical protein KEM48_011692 [Puccinia striiformis f. sp. tritici PST-130]
MAQLINVRSRSLGFGFMSFGLAIWATNPSNLSGQLREESQLAGGHEFATDDPGAVALSHNEATDINFPQRWVWDEPQSLEQWLWGEPPNPMHQPSGLRWPTSPLSTPEFIPSPAPSSIQKTPSGKHRDFGATDASGSPSPSVHHGDSVSLPLNSFGSRAIPTSNAQGQVVSQLSVGEPSRIQLSNSIDREAPAIGLRGFTDLTNLIQQHRPSASHRSYFTSKGKLAIPSLLDQQEKFRTNLYAAGDFGGRYHLAKKIHPSLPFVRFECDGEAGVLRILRDSTEHIQPDRTVVLHYKNLIALMHKLYEEELDSLKISTTTQELHQQEMLNWLDREFFLPIDSLPVTGPIIPQFPAWKAGMPEETLGRNQVMLIKYFSRQERDLELLPATASELVADFFKRHGTEYHSPGLPPKPSSDDPIPLEIYDLVRERVPLISKLVSDSQIYHSTRRGLSQLSNDQTLQMITGLLATFQNQCDRTSTKRLQVASSHPRLSIATYDCKPMQRTQNSQQLRVFRQKNSVPLDWEALLPGMTRLMVALDLFHIQILDHLKLLNIEVKNIETRRKTLLEWLIQSTVKPNGSLPVHGLVLIKDKRSPWDQLPDEDSMKLFGPVQQELIEYFSKNDKKIPSMKRKLAFLTAAWYQHYHAEELGCLAENVRKQVIPR